MPIIAMTREIGEPLLYDLVINTAFVTLPAAVQQVLTLAMNPEFEPTAESRAALADRALAARVRATLRASAPTGEVRLVVEAAQGAVRLEGVVASDEEREAALTVAGGVPGVVGVSGDIKVFRRPVR
jgi:osmotically-inducible protein OsmY